MIHEMTHIAGNSQVVNQRADTDNLFAFYLPLKRQIVISPKNLCLLTHTLKYTHTKIS